jgi:signal transduction histidine kinase
MEKNDATDTLERLVNLGHLSAGVGHHVINAFSAIVSNAELLRLDPSIPTPVEPAVLAETIINTALAAATVARRLIDYTRPVTSTESARSAFQPGALSLDLLVADVADAERASLKPGITLETELASIPPIHGEATQLRTMLSCLLRNAYEALSRQGGMIALTTSTDSRGWNVLEVRDTGKGMEPRSLERAVEPFFSTKPGHLGVGLSIANGIWRRHRGTLSIQSHPGEGTRLRLCVEPCREPAPAPSKGPALS